MGHCMTRRSRAALTLAAASLFACSSADDTAIVDPDAGGADGSVGADVSVGPPDDGGAKADTSTPVPPGLTADQTAAFQAVNDARTGAGSPPAQLVNPLDVSSEKHCGYYAANAKQPTCVANPHVEVSSCASYVGASFGDREKAAGYSGSASTEIMAFAGDPKIAVAEWLQTIYHRYPIIDPWERDFGYGKATSCDTMDWGVGAGSQTPDTTIAMYPYDGQTAVPLSFSGNEGPQPNAPPTGWPSGYPVSIHLKGTVSKFTITKDGDAAPLPSYTPNPLSFEPNAVFVSPNKPLLANTKYRVHAEGKNSAGPFTKDWAFTTGP